MPLMDMDHSTMNLLGGCFRRRYVALPKFSDDFITMSCYVATTARSEEEEGGLGTVMVLWNVWFDGASGCLALLQA